MACVRLWGGGACLGRGVGRRRRGGKKNKWSRGSAQDMPQQRSCRLPLYFILGGVSLLSLGLNLFAAKDLVLHHPARPEGRGRSKHMSADSPGRVPLGQPLDSSTGDGLASMAREPLARDSSDSSESPRMPQHDKATSSRSPAEEAAARDLGPRESGYWPSVSTSTASFGEMPGSSLSSSASSPSPLSSSPWLLILVPTVRRKVSYLEPVIEALMKQVPRRSHS